MDPSNVLRTGMHRFKQLSAIARFTVYGIFGALVVTGAGWTFAQAKLDDPGWEHLPSLLMKIHGAAAMGALILLGYLFNHVKIGWRMKKNRSSGLSVVFVYLFLIISGYGLYYASDEYLRALISRWHTWIGFGTLALLALHVLIGRAIRKKRERRTGLKIRLNEKAVDPLTPKKVRP
jgi:putative flippase GtrA